MKEKWPFVISMAVGAALLAASFLVKEEYYSTILFAMGAGMFAAEGFHLARLCWWQSPARKDAYEAKQQEAHIDAVDERKQMLRMRAGWLSNQIMFFVLLVLDLVLALLKAPAWVILILFVLWIGQYIIGVVIYHHLEKRM